MSRLFMNGLDMLGQRLLRVANPTAQDDGASKAYADGMHNEGLDFVAGLYYTFPAGNTTTTSPALNTVIATPFFARRTCTQDYLAVECTAAGTGVTLRARVCADLNRRPDYSNWAGSEVTVSSLTIARMEFPSPSFSLTLGSMYWMIFVQQGTAAATFRTAQLGGSGIVGVTTKPSATVIAANGPCCLVGVSSASGAISSTAQASWDNITPNSAIKFSTRAST